MHYDPNHSHTLPPRLSVESSSGEPWRSTSCDSIADSARSLALGKPLSAQEARSKKHARPEDIFPLMANAHESSSADTQVKSVQGARVRPSRVA